MGEYTSGKNQEIFGRRRGKGFVLLRDMGSF